MNATTTPMSKNKTRARRLVSSRLVSSASASAYARAVGLGGAAGPPSPPHPHSNSPPLFSAAIFCIHPPGVGPATVGCSRMTPPLGCACTRTRYHGLLSIPITFHVGRSGIEFWD
eukprot:29797-Pelagococcus_subviridis.AAC.14